MSEQMNYDANTQEQEFDLTGLLWRLAGKCWLIILFAVIGALIAGVYTFKFVTPMYQSTSKIYVVGSDSMLSLSDLQLGSYMTPDYTEVFKTRAVHEAVQARLGQIYPGETFTGSANVTNPSNTHILYITVTSPVPRHAKLMADMYAQVVCEFISAKMDMREPNIFEEARVPVTPVSPNRTRNVVIGFLIGALIAAAIITVQFILDDRIKTDDEVTKATNLPVLGLMPVQDMKKNETKGEPAGSYYRRKR